ncbi:MAG: hypothetical protein JNM18_13265 [Planctomycetaceae bacterium]|nr:hypothetical protein [Planctomycetaceae bacterium]
MSRVSQPLPIVDRSHFNCGAIGRWLAQVALALLVAVALTLAVRRAAGAFSRPLPSVILAVIGACVTLLIVSSRAALPTTLAGRALPSWLGATIGLALAVRGTSATGLVWLLIGVVAEALWHWRSVFTERDAVNSTLAEPPPLLAPVVSVAEVADDATAGDEILDLRQNLRRGVTADGVDVLIGEVQAVFAIEQRIETVHLAFCPPFERTPTLDLEQVEGPEARIEVGQLVPYGARLELKLSQPGPARVTIALSIRATSDEPATNPAAD